MRTPAPVFRDAEATAAPPTDASGQASRSALRPTSLDPNPFLSPQKAVVARRLRSKGGAHLLQIPWQAGYVTPWGEESQSHREEGGPRGRGPRGRGFTSTNPCRILTKMTQP